MSAAAAAQEPTRAMSCSSSSSDDVDSDATTSDDLDSDSTTSESSDDPDYRADTDDDDDKVNDATDVFVQTPAEAEGIISFLRTQDDVDAVCKKYGVPEDQHTARPAGDLRASSSPPPGAVCVYAHALEAGMRVPLHPFFRDALAHFGIAPTQLAPNGWRIMAGFVVLCHCAGVPPSLAVFRHFFVLCILNRKKKSGWYFFQSKGTSGLRFEGLPDFIKGWKQGFFFLSSQTPWPCPVEWGEPPESSFMEPVLTGEEKRSAAILLRAHGGAPVDIRTYLRDSSLADAKISLSSPAPAPPSCARTSAGSKGMDPSVYGMMKHIRAAAAQGSASAHKLNSEPGSEATGSLPLRGKKRSRDEADGNEVPPSSVLPNRPPAAHRSSAPAGVCPPPPGFYRKPTRFPDGQDDDGRTDWEAARELLQGALSSRQERVFAASRPSDVVASSYVAILQAANYASFSLGYALELEEKLREREAEIAALREQLEETEDELAAAKRTRNAERDSAQATEAVRQLLGSEERVRRRAEHALEGYRRWKDSRGPARRT